MQTFILLQRDFSRTKIKIHKIKAGNFDDAWDLVEEKYDNTNVQCWLLTPEEVKNLIIKLKKGLK